MEKKLAFHKMAPILSRTAMYLVLITFFFISIIPVIWIWSSAFKTHKEIFANPIGLPHNFYVQNIIDAWYTGHMNIYFKNSIIMSIPTILLVLTIASLSAYALAKLPLMGKGLISFYILIGMIIPFQGIIIPLYQVIKNLHLLNTRLAVIFTETSWQFGFATFMLAAFFREMPDDLLAAARIDGCNSFQVFRKIIIPLSKPAILSLATISFTWIWNDFILSLLFIYNDNLRPLPLGLMFFRGKYEANYALIAAGVTICSLPVIFVYILLQRHFVEGVVSSSLKA